MISKEHRTNIEAAIKETEYKYFGMYEFTEAQHYAVDLLVSVAQAMLDDETRDNYMLGVANANGFSSISEAIAEAKKARERAQESAGVLTDDQIREIWTEQTGTYEHEFGWDIMGFARAILAANKGK
jgi:hypothetical protein